MFFFYTIVYKKRKKHELESDIITPITHKYLENYQETTSLKMLFSTSKEVKQVLLNNTSIPYICVENKTLTEISGEQLYEINCVLKPGMVYSMQNYNNILNKIKYKLRKEIIQNYEFFK